MNQKAKLNSQGFCMLTFTECNSASLGFVMRSFEDPMVFYHEFACSRRVCVVAYWNLPVSLGTTFSINKDRARRAVAVRTSSVSRQRSKHSLRTEPYDGYSSSVVYSVVYPSRYFKL